MEYKTEVACGVGIIVLPESHRHYAISVEYNTSRLAGFTPKVFCKLHPGSEFLQVMYPPWDSEFEYELRFLNEYEDREIVLYSRYQERNYKEVKVLVKNAMTFESSYKFAHNKPADTTAYVISLHPHSALIATAGWLRSLCAPINHYIVFDNREDYKNAKKEFENSGNPLRVL